MRFRGLAGWLLWVPLVRAVITPEQISDAAVALHDLLTSSGWEHAFCGGLELRALGIDRTTKDVDVEVKKGSRLLKGFDALKNTVKKSKHFIVFDGRRTDGFRAFHRGGVGVDIWYRDTSHYPDYTDDIAITCRDGSQRVLPFYNLSHLFVEKFRTAGERSRSQDAMDLIFLFDAYRDMLDDYEIATRLPRAAVNATVTRYPDLEDCARRMHLQGFEPNARAGFGHGGSELKKLHQPA